MCVLQITECRMHSLPLATQHHDGGHSISNNAMHVHILDHKCCRAWQVFVMGPVIGDVNAGASIVKAMLVTSACMHLAPLLLGELHPHVEMAAMIVPDCAGFSLQGLLTASGPTMLNGQENPIVDVRDVALAHLRAAELPHASGWMGTRLAAAHVVHHHMWAGL